MKMAVAVSVPCCVPEQQHRGIERPHQHKNRGGNAESPSRARIRVTSTDQISAANEKETLPHLGGATVIHEHL